MRFSFTCILSLFLLVTTAAAIPVPREGHPASSLSRRDSYDDVVELYGRAQKAPPPHHPRAWGKTDNKKLPTKSKQERKEDHKAQQAVAGKTRNNNYLRRQCNLAKQGKAAPVTTKKEGKAARKQAVLDKKVKVQAKAKSSQEAAKQRLADRKAEGRKKFDTTRNKYGATTNLPNRKTTFTTPGGQKFTGADARRAVWNTHHFAGEPTNQKPAEFRNIAGSSSNPQRVIKSMKGAGTEFPINNDKHGYQGRPQPVKVKGQKPIPENPGPARAIVQKRPNTRGYDFKGVVSHDETKQGLGASAGEHAHHQIVGQQPESNKRGGKKHSGGDYSLDNSGDAMRNLLG
jgi:hypothetical protein